MVNRARSGFSLLEMVVATVAGFLLLGALFETLVAVTRQRMRSDETAREVATLLAIVRNLPHAIDDADPVAAAPTIAPDGWLVDVAPPTMGLSGVGHFTVRSPRGVEYVWYAWWADSGGSAPTTPGPR
jgi:hypothetical protein